MTRERSMPRWLLAVAPCLWMGWRSVMRQYTPANAELALLQGYHLVRGAKRVLAVTAHPDDLEATTGGALRLMALAGSRIDVVVLSDGRQQDNGRSNLAEIRQVEQQHAGNILGYCNVYHLGFRDLSLSRMDELQPELLDLWRSVRPEVVFTFDPSFPEPYLAHPDHLTAGRVVLNILRGGHDPEPAVYFYGTADTSVIVDISSVIWDKVDAVVAHRSQLQTWPALYSLLIRLYGRLRGRPVQRSYAEGFRVLTMPRLSSQVQRGQWKPPTGGAY